MTFAVAAQRCAGRPSTSSSIPTALNGAHYRCPRWQRVVGSYRLKRVRPASRRWAVRAVATPVKQDSQGAESRSEPPTEERHPGEEESGQPIASWTASFSSVVSAPGAVAGVLWHLVDRNLWARESTQEGKEAVHPSASVEEVPPTQPAEAELKEKVARAASKEAKEKNKKQWMDISTFLQTSGTLETRYLRMLSSLCALTYVMDRLTPRSLYRMHRLELVTSSRACELPSESPNAPSAEDVLDMGDCMAADSVSSSCMADWDEERKDEDGAEGGGLPPHLSSLQGSLSNIAPLSGKLAVRKVVWQGGHVSAADIVAKKLGEAASMAASLGGRASEVVTTARQPFASSVAAQLEHAAAEGGHAREVVEARRAVAADSAGSCPCEWFVCDDPVSSTRYFVIQGSDSLGSWITNVTFDPTPFETPSLGVKVHRGIYRAALALYDRFLPLIQEHLDSSPFATVTFTGHSLGGALATVLLLMYRARGVLDRKNIAPVYTFGSAAVFCSTGGVSLHADGAEGDGDATHDMLSKLDLPEGSVRNVVMHRDIVPRAFACDYSLVAPILARFAPPFREHGTLHGPDRGVLYSFVGRMMVLQPGSDLTFTGTEGYHPMMPSGAGLYTMRDPTLRDALPAGAACAHSTALSRAVMAFMDAPHPLDILADRRAYGHEGQISRYHNPDNYTRALGGVLRSRRDLWSSDARRNLCAGMPMSKNNRSRLCMRGLSNGWV
eukprot:CAMPEP_0177764746 /NCGR_PEP_ID=MMETSP0491_2-20121128/7581_1 /TAXON_ID=63592 /ORGANISM="Tetraselmis chuii, Strain PLY429" /LENGTH=724 /DNA_ID=CAMNT_0019280965 /DNA_START=198 /DNA_END=2368 /DNA_ORIENTATION=+